MRSNEKVTIIESYPDRDYCHVEFDIDGERFERWFVVDKKPKEDS